MVNFSEQFRRDAMKPGSRVHVAPGNRSRRGPIVLATDGTSPTAAEVVAAQQLAARLDVSLEVVSVLEPPQPYLSSPVVIASADLAAEDVRRKARETVVSEYVARFAGGGVPARIHVRVGGVVAEVTRFAREASATMIVMGSAPHRRLGRVVSGGRAAEMLHSALCPVLSVPPTFSGLPRLVVVGMDFGPSSVRAARAALVIAQSGGTVVLTHVLPPRILSDRSRHAPPIGSVDNVHQMFDRRREELRPYTPTGVNVEPRVVTGETVDSIIGVAGELNADLIAVGTHGQSLLARFLLGSVADSVLRRSRRPVLAAPPPLLP